MPITAMNHFTVLTHDLEASKAFYMDLLGLTEGFRPDLGFPGAWLYAGGAAILHLVAGRELPAHRRGVIDHMAFTAHDLRAVAARLTEERIEYTLNRLPSRGAWPVFCCGLGGLEVELDFEATEPAP